MSSPLLGVQGETPGNTSFPNSTCSMDSNFIKNPNLTERNYLGFSDCSSVDSSNVSTISEVNNNSLNLRATELRLGLPGFQSPERDPDNSDLTSSDKLDEKPLFPLLPSSSSQKVIISGHKRIFTDTMDSCSETKGLPSQQKSITTTETALNKVNNNSNPPIAKAQVVGWPPVRSFRKNIINASAKNNDEVDGKPGFSALFVKVSMDGAPYLRKVDLRGYSSYQELSSALEKMFSCFTIGQCGSRGNLSESKLRDLLHGSEYVVTYEDKDGDWMLVGDVPWDMFIGSCKRLKIMKGSDAIGLAPRSTEKSNNKN